MKGRTFHVLSVEHAELDKERQTDRQSDRHTETFLYGETLLRLKIMHVVYSLQALTCHGITLMTSIMTES